MNPPSPPEILLAGVGPGNYLEQGRATVALLERLCRIIAERVLEEQVVRAVTVTVAKPHVAIRHVLDDVSVTLHLERDAR